MIWLYLALGPPIWFALNLSLGGILALFIGSCVVENDDKTDAQ
jgi:hypothetical protein